MIELSTITTVRSGPLLNDMHASYAGAPHGEEGPRACASSGVAHRTFAKKITDDDALHLIDEARVRGRAGRGFPVAHKLYALRRAAPREKILVCNAHSFGMSAVKFNYLISLNTDYIVSAILTAACLADASRCILCIGKESGERISQQICEIEVSARRWARQCSPIDLSRSANIEIVITPARFVAGEETALVNLINGKPAVPRAQPPLLIEGGVSGQPTVVIALETLLHTFYALRYGAAAVSSTGTRSCTGSMLFTVGGDVQRPGIYEVPFGTKLSDLLLLAASDENIERIRYVLVGGIGSIVVTSDHLDLPLDHDCLHAIGGSLGVGDIVASVAPLDKDRLRTIVEQLYEESCGQCTPCKDGLRDISTSLGTLTTCAVDSEAGSRNNGPIEILPIINNRRPQEHLLNKADRRLKIPDILQFMEYRGDCAFSRMAVASIHSARRAITKMEWEGLQN